MVLSRGRVMQHVKLICDYLYLLLKKNKLSKQHPSLLKVRVHLSVFISLMINDKVYSKKRKVMFVFFLHVGSDLILTDLHTSYLGILLHCLEVCIDLFVRLEGLLRNTVQRSSKDPAEKSPDCQVGNGHPVSNIKPCQVKRILLLSGFRSDPLPVEPFCSRIFSRASRNFGSFPEQSSARAAFFFWQSLILMVAPTAF